MIQAPRVSLNQDVFISAARTRSKCEIDQDENNYHEDEPRHAHHAGVSDVARSFRLDAGYGSDGGDYHGEGEPDQPIHGASS
jgi:hypothetical protein